MRNRIPVHAHGVFGSNAHAELRSKMSYQSATQSQRVMNECVQLYSKGPNQQK